MIRRRGYRFPNGIPRTLTNPPRKEPAMTDRPIFTASFWADAAERAVSTAANAAATILATAGVGLIGDAPWYAIVSAAGIAAALDVLRSLAAAPRGNPGTAGYTPAIEASGQPGVIARFISGGAS